MKQVISEYNESELLEIIAKRLGTLVNLVIAILIIPVIITFIYLFASII